MNKNRSISKDTKAITVWRDEMQRHLIWSEGFRDFSELWTDVELSLRKES